MLETLAFACMGLIIAMWIVRHVLMSLTKKSDVFIRPDQEAPVQDGPLVSVIIPVCNERKNVRRCLRSVLSQDYPNIEVIVVDDRSTDATPDIVTGIFEEYRSLVTSPKGSGEPLPERLLSLIHVDHLPQGWTGKTHALVRGASLAKGEFLLFLDADTWHHPSNITQVMSYEKRHDADMISLLPRLENIGFWERLLHPVLSGMLILRYPPHAVNDPAKKNCAFANGQYILIRRSAYDAVGGHEAVRGELLEDIALAKLVKRSGRFRPLVAMGQELSTVRMYGKIQDIWRGWSRIFLAGLNRSVMSILASMGLMITFSLAPFVVLLLTSSLLLVGPPSLSLWLFFGLSALQVALVYWGVYRMYGLSHSDRRYIPLYPFAGVIGLCVLVASLWKLLRRQDITWRGTQYAHANTPRASSP